MSPPWHPTAGSRVLGSWGGLCQRGMGWLEEAGEHQAVGAAAMP